eukprot:1698326-Amphidinium_carterae.1
MPSLEAFEEVKGQMPSLEVFEERQRPSPAAFAECQSTKSLSSVSGMSGGARPAGGRANCGNEFDEKSTKVV